MNYELLNKLKNVNGKIIYNGISITDFKELYDTYSLYVMINYVYCPIDYNLFVYYLLNLLKYEIVEKEIQINLSDKDVKYFQKLFIKIHDKGCSYLYSKFLENMEEINKETERLLKEKNI